MLPRCVRVCACACVCACAVVWVCERASQAVAARGRAARMRTGHADMTHFMHSTRLQHYINDIVVLIEPVSPCSAEVPVVVMVPSAPAHRARRQAIRNTWGRLLLTYFIVGLERDIKQRKRKLLDNYLEAGEHNDLVVYSMMEHYQNLTLKTMLILQFALRACTNAQFLFKTDDDMFVNPFLVHQIIEDHRHSDIIGFTMNDSRLRRDPSYRWFVPRWLAPAAHVPKYALGSGYIINRTSIPKLYNMARKVPLINLEDVYLMYFVARHLHLNMTHEERLKYQCDFKENGTYAVRMLHNVVTAELYDTWNKMIERRLTSNFTSFR